MATTNDQANRIAKAQAGYTRQITNFSTDAARRFSR
jgi:hypothetical protein